MSLRPFFFPLVFCLFNLGIADSCKSFMLSSTTIVVFAYPHSIAQKLETETMD